VIRTLEGNRPLARVRLWVGGASPDGRPLPSSSTVAEWAGRTGHPTSYALLGAAPGSEGIRFLVPGGDVFVESLAGHGDEVTFGLPDVYKREVEDVLLQQAPFLGWDVLVAAHGRFGSSQMAFRRLATFLLKLNELDLSKVPDDDVWSAWNAAGAAWRES
jgi:hypothetical protein